MCAEPRFPGVYADIMIYQDWIKANSSNRLVASNLFLVVFLFIQILFKS
jgi:secreted trypsin-like serine protease